MGTRSGSSGPPAQPAQRVPDPAAWRWRSDLSRRQFTGAAAAWRTAGADRRTGRLGAAWRRRPPARAASLVAVPQRSPRRAGRTGGLGAIRSRRDELADGQPAFAAGEFLPADTRTPRDPDRAPRIPLGS